MCRTVVYSLWVRELQTYEEEEKKLPLPMPLKEDGETSAFNASWMSLPCSVFWLLLASCKAYQQHQPPVTVFHCIAHPNQRRISSHILRVFCLFMIIMLDLPQIRQARQWQQRQQIDCCNGNEFYCCSQFYYNGSRKKGKISFALSLSQSTSILMDLTMQCQVQCGHLGKMMSFSFVIHLYCTMHLSKSIGRTIEREKGNQRLKTWK